MNYQENIDFFNRVCLIGVVTSFLLCFQPWIDSLTDVKPLMLNEYLYIKNNLHIFLPLVISIIIFFIQIQNLWINLLHILIKPYYRFLDTVIISFFLASIFSTRTIELDYLLVWTENSGYFFIMYLIWVIYRLYKKDAIFMEKPMKSVFYNDKAIEEISEDSMERREFAKNLAEILKKADNLGNFVVGLYGQWGTGKSSVLNLLKKYMEKEKEFLIIQFNPWHFTNEECLIRQFLNSFHKEIIKNNIGNSSAIKVVFKDYIEQLSKVQMKTGFVNFSLHNIMGKQISGDIIENKKNIENILKCIECKIVVIIDDIDRLNPREIREMFTLVKLIANFPNTYYIMAFDEKIVTQLIGGDYCDNPGSIGQEFLDKIIQISLYLPPLPTEKFEELFFNDLDNQILKQQIIINNRYHERLEIFKEAISNIIGQRTLRKNKKYLNALVFSIPLLKGEVNINDQIIIEFIRVYFPDIYDFIKSYSYVLIIKDGDISALGNNELTVIEKDAHDKLKDLLKKYNNIEIDCISKLFVELFPYKQEILIGTFEKHYGIMEKVNEMRDNKRLCSNEYFEIYFLYNVPSNKISDNFLNDFIRDAKTMEINELSEKIKVFDVKSLISKLSIVKNDITNDSVLSEKMTLMLVQNGEFYPREKNGCSIGGSWTRAAILISDLIALHLNKHNEDQIQYCKKVLNEASPISFTKEVFRCIKSKRFLDDACIQDIGKYIREKLHKEIKSSKGEFFENYIVDLKDMLELCHEFGGNDNIINDIMSWLTEEEKIERFINIFILNFKDYCFDEISYNYMAKIVPTNKIFDLINKYGIAKKTKLPDNSIGNFLKLYKPTT